MIVCIKVFNLFYCLYVLYDFIQNILYERFLKRESRKAGAAALPCWNRAMTSLLYRAFRWSIWFCAGTGNDCSGIPRIPTLAERAHPISPWVGGASSSSRRGAEEVNFLHANNVFYFESHPFFTTFKKGFYYNSFHELYHYWPALFNYWTGALLCR